MQGAQLAAMRRELMEDEGVRLTPYRCTAGHLTVLVGYNLDARGWDTLQVILERPIDRLRPAFTLDDARRQLDHDIALFESRILAREGALYRRLDAVRQRALVNFVFNLGGKRAAQFRTTLARIRLALAQTDEVLQQACWDAAAFHLMDSLWARQVDDGLGGKRGRADRLCLMLRTGTAPQRAAA